MTWGIWNINPENLHIVSASHFSYVPFGAAIANPVTCLGREKRGELQDTGHPRPESQMTARPFQFAHILLTLMFSTVTCSEVVCSKWNVLLNLSRMCNSAERDLQSVSFVFLGTDQCSIYWLNEFSNLLKVIKEGSWHSPARGILKLKTDTPLSERYTRPKHHASLEK